MGVFDERVFCEMLGKHIDERWNALMERAKEKQAETLARLEAEIKEWERIRPPTYEGAVFYHEDFRRLLRIEEVPRVLRESAEKQRFLRVERTFDVGYEEDGKIRPITILTVSSGETVEDIKRKLDKKYREVLEEYERAKNLGWFIELDNLKKLGEIVAIKKQIC